MSVEENKAIVRRYWDEIWNQGKFEVIDELLADTFVQHGPWPFACKKLGFKRMTVVTVTFGREKEPPPHYDPGVLVAEGDLVVSRIKSIVRNRSVDDVRQWMEMMLSASVDPGMWLEDEHRTHLEMYRIVDGKIQETWIAGSDDATSMLRMSEKLVEVKREAAQPGHKPASGPAPGTAWYRAMEIAAEHGLGPPPPAFAPADMPVEPPPMPRSSEAASRKAAKRRRRF